MNIPYRQAVALVSAVVSTLRRYRVDYDMSDQAVSQTNKFWKVDDVEWFAAHRDRRYRIRPATEAEGRPDQRVLVAFLAGQPYCANADTLVHMSVVLGPEDANLPDDDLSLAARLSEFLLIVFEMALAEAAIARLTKSEQPELVDAAACIYLGYQRTSMAVTRAPVSH